MKNKTILLSTFIVVMLSGCGESCKDHYQIDRKHSMCSKLDTTLDERGNVIQTYGCATKNGEAFIDYYVRGSQLCYKSTFHY
jgi:hypothetical protein